MMNNQENTKKDSAFYSISSTPKKETLLFQRNIVLL